MATTATAVWRARTGGNNNNGGGYDAGISGAGTDYSQQDAAQATFTTSLACTGNASSVLTDGGANNLFTSVMKGNAINITAGTGFTAGIYWITGFTDANNVTLDRTPASGAGAASAGTGRVGGGWADFWTNYTSTNVKPGNIIFIRASGAGSVASPDYTTPVSPGYVTGIAGDSTNGMIAYIGENGRPYIKSNNSRAIIWFNISYAWFENLYLIGAGADNQGLINNPGGPQICYNVIFDQNGFNSKVAIFGSGVVANCEFLSSSTGSNGTNVGVTFINYNCRLIGCNFHDLIVATAIVLDTFASLQNCIIAKCTGDGVLLDNSTTNWTSSITGCTFDGNTGHGINISNVNALVCSPIMGNIISNHTGVGKYGITVSGTLASNDRLRCLIDFNSFYNNTADVNGITQGGSSTIRGHTYNDNVGVDPQYAAQSTENYAIGTNLKALGYPRGAFLQSKSGQTTGVTSYMDAGGVQRQEPAGGGGGMLVHPGMVGGAHG